MWAAEEINLLAIPSPEKCWKFVLDIIEQIDNEWVLTNLAAGLIENVLVMKPNEVIALMKKEIPRNKKLQSLIKNVWKKLIPDDVCNQLQSLNG